MSETNETALEIVVELDSPNGPRVTVWGLADRSDQATADAQTAEIEAEIPEGWEIAWGNEVRTSTGGYAYPLTRPDGGVLVRADEENGCEACWDAIREDARLETPSREIDGSDDPFVAPAGWVVEEKGRRVCRPCPHGASECAPSILLLCDEVTT